MPNPFHWQNSSNIFYLAMHGVSKSSSSTTKLRVDASVKTRTGASLKDTLILGPTLYPQLIDIVAISGDVTKIYRAVELAPEDRDLH